MKSIAPLIVALVVCAAILFAPHHRREPDSFKPNTLAGIYRDLISDMPTRWNVERGTLLLLILAGMFASVAPIVLAAMLRAHRPAGSATFGIVGAIVVVGAAANFSLILLNQTTFAFGGRALPGDAIAFAWAVAIVQALVALTTVALAVSSRFASLLF